jgi:hypothetical protein
MLISVHFNSSGIRLTTINLSSARSLKKSTMKTYHSLVDLFNKSLEALLKKLIQHPVYHPISVQRRTTRPNKTNWDF